MAIRSHSSKSATVLRAGASLAIVASGLSGTAATAQTASEAEEADGGDIVVTAQKREQKLRDVGIAVSVVGEEDVQRMGINNAIDVVRAIPNLKYNAYGSSQVVFNIRGVSQNDYGDQQEPPVAVYQDDSYASSITTASFPVFDLARVEALRGPQGTLFGRNATGGAVQFVSNQPTDTFEGYASLTYGRYNQTIFEGALSGPLGESLSARISGIYNRDDGYMENITPGEKDRGANNHWALRGILAFEPSSSFTAKLTLRYAQADKERQAGIYSLAPACPNAQFQGEFLAANQVCDYWNNYFGSSLNGGVPGSTGNGYTNPAITPSQGGDPWKTAGTGLAYVDRKIFGATLRIDADVGAVSLTSISDFQSLKKFYIEGGDGVPELPYDFANPPVYPFAYFTAPCPAPAQSVSCYPSGTIFFQDADVKQYSQELRAAWSTDNNYLVVGAYGLIIDGDFKAKYATPFQLYDPDVAIKQKTESFAFFAQNEFKFSDQLKLITGLRYWKDSKRGTYDASEFHSGFTMHWGPDAITYNDPTGTTPLTGVTVTPAAATPSFDGLTWRMGLDYKPSPDTLIYASFNRGSKSGGFTFSTGTPFLGQYVIDTINNIPYNPEKLDAYELGLKTRIGSNTDFNLTAFYYDYKDYQAFVQVGFSQVVRNLPASNKGIEAELTSRPVKGLTLQLNVAFQDSEVKDVLLPDGATLVNHDLPQAPSFSGSAMIRYEFPLAGGTASLQADSMFSSSTCFTVMCAPVEEEGAYHVENLRLGFEPGDGRLSVALFVNNLFNREYRVYAFDGSLYWGDTLGVYAKPRTWGVNLRYNFGN
ncbi:MULTISPECIES: TonB-dependent receptor [unclassified Novosphingobium]|uniref:TonB-dependent receptor n=1 Tax=unclassified Novosphingobium TaxID=2644732 RepID=UPI000ED8F975|nr:MULTISPECIES: TonB-dependent receptor [unclassified Novosphingobium]HCF24797.1 TonB-dependent receptor [Novosphingobium sp.]HQV01991.1 TonB-dependent receptor [Novosphingobium sp.]